VALLTSLDLITAGVVRSVQRKASIRLVNVRKSLCLSDCFDADTEDCDV